MVKKWVQMFYLKVKIIISAPLAAQNATAVNSARSNKAIGSTLVWVWGGSACVELHLTLQLKSISNDNKMYKGLLQRVAIEDNS